MVFTSWRELISSVGRLNEQELRESINYEVSTYRRKAFISRMHQRYARLRSERERALLLAGEMLL